MRMPPLTSAGLERPLAASSACAGTPYRRDSVSRLSPWPTTTGVPPAALHPAADPPARWVAEATGAGEAAPGSGALATVVARASGAAATLPEGAAPEGVAWAVCELNGLVKGLLLASNRVTSAEHADSEIRARP